MESSISHDAVTLMYLCKEKGNQRRLLEVLKCIRMETKKAPLLLHQRERLLQVSRRSLGTEVENRYEWADVFLRKAITERKSYILKVTF